MITRIIYLRLIKLWMRKFFQGGFTFNGTRTHGTNKKHTTESRKSKCHSMLKNLIGHIPDQICLWISSTTDIDIDVRFDRFKRATHKTICNIRRYRAKVPWDINLIGTCQRPRIIGTIRGIWENGCVSWHFGLLFTGRNMKQRCYLYPFYNLLHSKREFIVPWARKSKLFGVNIVFIFLLFAVKEYLWNSVICYMKYFISFHYN